MKQMIKFVKNWFKDEVSHMSGPEEGSSIMFKKLYIVNLFAHVVFTAVGLAGVIFGLEHWSISTIFMILVSSPFIIISIITRIALNKSYRKYSLAVFREDNDRNCNL